MNDGRISIVRVKSLAEAEALPLQRLETDLSGRPSEYRPGFRFGCDDEYLWFLVEAHGVPNFDRTKGTGEFAENLWQQDVAEFFIGDQQSGRYQEFNLSPSGAWWSCLFTTYRERAPGFIPPEAACNASLSPELWKASLSLKRKTLAVDISADARMNVTFILAGRYFSLSRPDLPRPDFHRAEGFVPVSISSWDK